MNGPIKILVKCPDCNNSLINSELRIDGLPSIGLKAKVADKMGHIYLSQLYGSFTKRFENVDDIEDSIAEFSCPHCYKPFPVQGTCDCKAPIIAFALQIGGIIKICTRNGCSNHSLEFVDPGHAFALFQSQDETRLG